VNVDPQQSARLGACESALGFLDIGQDSEAAPIVRLAIESRSDMSGRPLQEADAEPGLQLLDHFRCR